MTDNFKIVKTMIRIDYYIGICIFIDKL